MCRAQELLSSALLRAPAVLHSLLSHARHAIFSGSTFLFFGLVLVYNCLRGGAGGRAGAGGGGARARWAVRALPLTLCALAELAARASRPPAPRAAGAAAGRARTPGPL